LGVEHPELLQKAEEQVMQLRVEWAQPPLSFAVGMFRSVKPTLGNVDDTEMVVVHAVALGKDNREKAEEEGEKHNERQGGFPPHQYYWGYGGMYGNPFEY
jgi:hypothetical protein